MIKIKYLVAGFITVSLLVSGAIGYVTWNNNQSNKIVRTAVTGSKGTESQVLSSNKNNQATVLSVAPNTNSTSLGSTPIGSGQSTTTRSNNNSDDSLAKMLDPSTFGQYDHYKNNTSALFKDLLVGEGAELASNKKAAVLYKVWLTNGTLVDASRENEKGEMQPFSFTVGAREVIQAWDTSLIGMKVGGVRFLVVPPSVGYGSTPKGNIPANSVLIFQIQLLAVQ